MKMTLAACSCTVPSSVLLTAEHFSFLPWLSTVDKPVLHTPETLRGLPSEHPHLPRRSSMCLLSTPWRLSTATLCNPCLRVRSLRSCIMLTCRSTSAWCPSPCPHTLSLEFASALPLPFLAPPLFPPFLAATHKALLLSSAYSIVSLLLRDSDLRLCAWLYMRM